MTVKVEPLRTFVLVDPLPAPPKSDILHVIAPDDAPTRGVILRIGDEVKDLKEGQTILYNRGVAIDSGVDGQFLVPEAGVFLIITEET